jgi:hypothetical protein
MNELVPCPGCRRHVRVRETSCPFCAGALVEPAARGPVLKPRGRMSRAALVAAGAALLGAAACEDNVAVPAYGAPFPDGAADAADAGADAVDANQTGDGSVSEMGTLIYGSPPAPGE